MSEYKQLEDDLKAQVYKLKSLVEEGELSEDEYNELVEDIIDSANISAKIGTEADAIMVGRIIDAVKLIVSLV
jgi:polyhydroxyalkanoate synthesis regulator phasin